MSQLTDIRDTVALTIAVKQGLDAFYYANDFVLKKTWRPWVQLEDLFDPTKFPHGQVYVIGGRSSDFQRLSRSGMTQRDYPIQIGFQHAIQDIDNTAEIDAYVGFVEELEETCRLEVDIVWSNIAFTRLEVMRDPNGIPLAFVQIREVNVFEAYFSAIFTEALPDYNISTTTTTTT